MLGKAEMAAGGRICKDLFGAHPAFLKGLQERR